MDTLRRLFEQYTGKRVEELCEIGASGSNRRYYRIVSGAKSMIGVTGTDKEENAAFIALSRHFIGKGLNVPEVFAVSEDGMSYIQQDLGDMQLYKAVTDGRMSGSYSEKECELLCKTIAKLPDFQFRGAEDLDFGVCYPSAEFDERLVMFDLNYFKYCFLKTSGLEFNESRLQDDFEKLSHDLLEEKSNTFLYRDFQARNVMLLDGEPYFIDFQGGRKGPVYYDVASFIWQARAAYPEELRSEMLSAYIQSLRTYIPDLDEEAFQSRLRLFVLFRTLQVLGAYGFRGGYEKKAHFVESIPFAIGNLRQILQKPFNDYPYLNDLLNKLTKLPRYEKKQESKGLTVKVYSFSYKKGIPEDDSGNGGGYVFDCRSIDNPGRHEQYRAYTGMDANVIKYLEDDGGVIDFLSHAYAIVDKHVEYFIKRNFTSLQISFGCTGGQHRSVYCAEHMASHISEKYGVRVKLIHREQGVEKEM